MLPDQNVLKSLLEQQDTLCLSLFLPLRVNAPHENLVRANNLLKQAEEKVAKATCATEAQEFLRPVSEAIRARLEKPEGSRGLAAFACTGFHREFPLPIEFAESVSLDRRFHILPVLSLFSQHDRFYILALSQKHIRLFEANRAGATEIAVEGIPAELDSSHQDFQEEGFRKELQFHAAGAGAGKRSIIYHGGADEPKDRLTGYLRDLFGGLFKKVNLDGAPLVIAAVERLASIYREIKPYSNVVENFVAGNPDLLKPQELHSKAWEIVQPVFAGAARQAAEKYKRLGKNLISHDPEEIIVAAKNGRVGTLFIATGAGMPQADGEDFLNLTACLTLRDRGKVYILPPAEMPEKAEIAASYRY